VVEPERAERRNRTSQRVINVGLVTNVSLAAIKTTAGLMGGSPALVSDGINSISDTVYYLVVKFFIRQAALPPDREHPYGHSQLESIASLIVGAFVLTTAVALFWSSATRVVGLLAGSSPAEAAAPATLWIALGTVGIKAVVGRWTRIKGQRMRNAALEALADDHRGDLIASIAVAAGILMAQLGLTWLDPAAGGVVAGVIFHTGIAILRNSTYELMDAVPSGQLADQINERLCGIPEIVQVEQIHAHRFGPHFMVNLTVGLNGDMSIEEGDRVCTQIENTLYLTMPEVRMVYVHYHPAGASAVPRA
jgi:cation diffusion facilitator family transporter